MKVKDLMTVPARTCRATEHLGIAARTMLDEDCGCLPVIDTRGRLVGILTDRDICLTVAARHKTPWDIAVKDAMTRKVFTCSSEDPIDRALVVMKEHRVRRLPVVDDEGQLKGLLSIDDLIRNTGYAKGRLASDSVIDVLRHVCTPKVAPPEIVTA
jgi:CBS domain-containing protein